MPIDTTHKCPYCARRSLSFYHSIGSVDFFSCEYCLMISSTEMIVDDMVAA